GFGGCRGGGQASKIAIESLKSSLNNLEGRNGEVRERIINAFEVANKKVLALGIGAATTLAVLEVRGTKVRPYHVGDSEILVVSQRGQVKFQTVSHSPVGYAVESGVMDAAEAMHHEERHVVSNMIGSAEMHIEVGPVLELAKRDTVIIASDGLSDNLHTSEIANFARKGSLTEVVARLSETALTRMQNPLQGDPSKPDDLTFVLYRPRKAS
ncbi:MAG: protein phosphatase 2C domain-containing protein, partial [Bdellovibrionales bacterium]|nr:protein phosphatase 2C domain-containing protein [Bdellovibrionales bacterium]